MWLTGLCGIVLVLLGWGDFALRIVYFPVVDMQYVDNLYLEDEGQGKVSGYE